MMARCFILTLLLLCFIAVDSISFMDPKVLVVVDDKHLYQSHSVLFTTLEEKGYQLTVKTAQDSNLSLTSEDGEYLFSHLFLLCPKTFGIMTRGLERTDVLDFVEAGGNVIFFANTGYEEPTSKLFESFGCELDEPQSLVLDHLHYSSDCDSYFGGKHSAVLATGITHSSVVYVDSENKPIIYQGIGMGIFRNRELIFPILWGSSSAYSYFPNTRVTELPIVSGEETVMMAALQSRNGARVLLSGSTDICSNSLQTTFLGNKHFCSQIVSWTLGERGMLRTQNWRHHKVGDSITNHSNDMYRVRDEIEFLVDIEEWNGTEHGWKPFLGNDVQLEFIMLDPYIRKTLVCVDETKGSYYTRFRIPDRIGVYKFSIGYYRRGYSPIQASQVVSVRPFRHDEYERFILQAYPYYAAALSMLLGVFSFGFVFLHGKGMFCIPNP
ncbi:hypothetical protein GpartN1_g4312.t1 [Galdieria partita]|uniref:Dolichyl-diphosphooligosaccharide--protein glycosyltransferase 48 kDa subunit n=1 Tax=Galdieria partita TaxID=83374 RepID=A0A9C7UR87_9RHOD|nr:hypothetical protein GpartN1_g4312.t1 [Galdieria partita]